MIVFCEGMVKAIIRCLVDELVNVDLELMLEFHLRLELIGQHLVDKVCHNRA